MPAIYYYKLKVDDNGAPCVQNGMLSLAICKPMLRRKAVPGDLVFGFAANALHADNRLIYIAEITDKVRDGEYYRKRRFSRRLDSVYRWRKGRFRWRSGALFHSPRELRHDLGGHPEYARAEVLLSRSFRYFGADGSAAYKTRYRLIAAAVEDLGQGHRVNHNERLRRELLALKQQVWQATPRRRAGRPTSGPQGKISHRGGLCGVLDHREGH